MPNVSRAWQCSKTIFEHCHRDAGRRPDDVPGFDNEMIKESGRAPARMPVVASVAVGQGFLERLHEIDRPGRRTSFLRLDVLNLFSLDLRLDQAK